METENVQTNENQSPKPDDAGNGNKMASSSTTPINREKTSEHELKILEVEGAVTTETTQFTETIDLDDDEIDVDNVQLISELQTALIDNNNGQASKLTEDPLLDEKTSTKTEPSSDAESIGSYNGPDPMGLLERIDSSKEVEDDDADEEEEESADEASSSGSRRISRSERWQIWMKRWAWLLHEESDNDYAFCLYCNVVINVNKKLKFIQQHNLSLYHQERENNYLAFKNRDELSHGSENEVKHEFGSDSYVAAMKLKRASEVERLNNFNWQRWLSWHPWLERIQAAGTIGLCKYCNVRMNVEFVYLRKRHEASKGHCEALRTPDKPSRKRKRSASKENVKNDTAQDSTRANGKAAAEDSTVMTIVGAGVESTDPSDWCELLPDTNPQQCRCTLCNCPMAITSFMRHLKTKVHCNNLISQKQNQMLNLNRGVWAQYEKQHPWLVADPSDPTLAYCHVCCRRFMYGHSEIKRKNHENSEKHTAAEAAVLAAEAAANEFEQSEPEQSEALSEGSDEDYIEEDEKLSTSPRSSAEPTELAGESRKAKHVVRHFSWLRYSKDRKIQLCRFCRVRFTNEASKVRHEHSARHKKLVMQFRSRQTKRYKEAEKRRKAEAEANGVDMDNDEEQSDIDSTMAENPSEATSHTKATYKAAQKTGFKPVPATMQGKVMVWKDRFPWLSYKRSEERHNYGWCKLCEVSVFLPSFKYASKHQRSSRHIRLRFERKRSAHMPPNSMTTPAPAAVAVAALTTGEAKHKAAMAELQAKYDWLEPDTIDENHCHCKVCDTRLPIKLFYLRQHDGSRKHSEMLERYRNNSEANTLNSRAIDADPAPSVMEVDQESDEALSVKSECSAGEQPQSKRMRRSLEVRRILRVLRDSVGKRSEERSQMDMAKDMICSSFDIVSRLRTLEREHESPNATAHNQSMLGAVPLQQRGTMDLFFESITQTMKSLPADLAAEGKAKIMQIVCDLELRGMHRNTTLQTPRPAESQEATASSGAESTTSRPRGERLTFEEVMDVTPASPESVSSSISIDDLLDEQQEQSLPKNSSNNNPAVGNLPELTVTPHQRSALGSSNPSTPAAASVAVSPPSSANGRVKEVPLNIRRYLPSTVQVGSSNTEAGDPLRVVPINKLTTPNANQNSVRNSFNGASHSSPAMQRSGQQPLHLSPNAVVMATPPSSNSNSNSSVHSDLSNGTLSGSGGCTPIYRKIRVNNGTSTKLITVPSSGQHQQPQQQQQKLPVRHSGNSTPKVAPLTQAQAQAQAQLRTLGPNRQVARQLPPRPSQP